MKLVKAGLLPVSILLLTVNGYGQTTLTQVFRDLHSQDPKVRAAANKVSVEVFERELPTISAETSTLCTALTDSDAYIRQQASAVFSVLAQLHPEDAAMISACSPQLIKAGVDATDQVRQNSLLALAYKVGGPPAAAAPDFEAALNDPILAVKEIGATGIMNLPPGSSSGSIKLLTDKMSSEQDAESKEALLTGVTQARKTNPDVAQSASRLIADSDPRVQSAAVLAVESLNSDKSLALSQLQNYQTSGSLNPEAKQKLDAAVLRLQVKTGHQD